MREIKFRGKSTSDIEHESGVTIKEGSWIYGHLIVDKDQAYIVQGVIECNSEYISIEYWCPVDIKTVGQYTGLKGKNGVEIYEGDILRYISKPNQTTVVRWTTAGFNLRAIRKPGHMYEVIGNIYDNPELLEVEKNA